MGGVGVFIFDGGVIFGEEGFNFLFSVLWKNLVSLRGLFVCVESLTLFGMEYDVLFREIKEQLRERFPEVEDFSSLIAERLGMDRRGVQRRLNGDIRFSLSEAFDVAREFGLSLDRMYAPKDDKQNFLELFGYEYQLNEVEENIQRVQDIYRLACESEESSMGLATLSLPTIFWYNREWARTLFFIFGLIIWVRLSFLLWMRRGGTGSMRG